MDFAVTSGGLLCGAFVFYSSGSWQSVFPEAYPPSSWTGSQSLTTVLDVVKFAPAGGMVVGMLWFGALMDRIGRYRSSLYTSGIMLTSLFVICGISAAGPPSSDGVVIAYGVAFAVFGVVRQPLFDGVEVAVVSSRRNACVFLILCLSWQQGFGGEYPLACVSSVEEAHTSVRGRTSLLAFSMEGVGNFSQLLVLFVLVRRRDSAPMMKGIRIGIQTTSCSPACVPVSPALSGARVGVVWQMAGAGVVNGSSEALPSQLRLVLRLQYVLPVILTAALVFVRVTRGHESLLWRLSGGGRRAYLGVPIAGTTVHGTTVDGTTVDGSKPDGADSAHEDGDHDDGHGHGEGVCSPLVLLVRYHWLRLLSQAAVWFLWDFAFYGACSRASWSLWHVRASAVWQRRRRRGRCCLDGACHTSNPNPGSCCLDGVCTLAGHILFQTRFLSVLRDSDHLPYITIHYWSLFFGIVAVVGYYVAAAVVDRPVIGRRRLQGTRRRSVAGVGVVLGAGVAAKRCCSCVCAAGGFAACGAAYLAISSVIDSATVSDSYESSCTPLQPFSSR